MPEAHQPAASWSLCRRQALPEPPCHSPVAASSPPSSFWKKVTGCREAFGDPTLKQVLKTIWHSVLPEPGAR